jgi:hypothetical protein
VSSLCGFFHCDPEVLDRLPQSAIGEAEEWMSVRSQVEAGAATAQQQQLIDAARSPRNQA